MYFVIKWAKDGFTRLTFTASGENVALKYALMREKQGYEVDIDTCSAYDFQRLRIEADGGDQTADVIYSD